jgi:hypothetical protein
VAATAILATIDLTYDIFAQPLLTAAVLPLLSKMLPGTTALSNPATAVPACFTPLLPTSPQPVLYISNGSKPVKKQSAADLRKSYSVPSRPLMRPSLALIPGCGCCCCTHPSFVPDGLPAPPNSTCTTCTGLLLLLLLVLLLLLLLVLTCKRHSYGNFALLPKGRMPRSCC